MSARNVESSQLSLEKEIENLVADIRSEPQHAVHRWSMFQCQCIKGEWQRALLQLQVYGQLDKEAERVVQTYRDLVRAERWREGVMAGSKRPAFIYDDVPDWMHLLLAALDLAAGGDLTAADQKRKAALDAAPLVIGRSGQQSFEWLGDSDSRLGPVCEIITSGSYRWVSLSDIAGWRVQRPSSLIDFVWTPCMLSLNDGAVLHGFMPARYPLHQETSESQLLGQETVWRDLGETGVIGIGRKTWTSSAGDFDIFELSECGFGEQAIHDIDDSAAELDQ